MTSTIALIERTPRTDKLVKELSVAHYNESKSERACRIENPLMELCRKLERELTTLLQRCEKADREIDKLRIELTAAGMAECDEVRNLDQKNWQTTFLELTERCEKAEAEVERRKSTYSQNARLVADYTIAAANATERAEKAEAERVRLWNECRDLRATIDVEKAVVDTVIQERDDAIANAAHWKKEAYGYNWQKNRVELAERQRDLALKALEPFAKASEQYPATFRDTDAPVGFRGFNLGHLRAARNAMGEAKT